MHFRKVHTCPLVAGNSSTVVISWTSGRVFRIAQKCNYQRVPRLSDHRAPIDRWTSSATSSDPWHFVVVPWRTRTRIRIGPNVRRAISRSVRSLLEGAFEKSTRGMEQPRTDQWERSDLRSWLVDWTLLDHTNQDLRTRPDFDVCVDSALASTASLAWKVMQLVGEEGEKKIRDVLARLFPSSSVASTQLASSLTTHAWKCPRTREIRVRARPSTTTKTTTFVLCRRSLRLVVGNDNASIRRAETAVRAIVV